MPPLECSVQVVDKTKKQNNRYLTIGALVEHWVSCTIVIFIVMYKPSHITHWVCNI